MRNIPTATAAVGQAPKLFALNRMVEVLLYNISRVYDLWAIFLRCGGSALFSSCGQLARLRRSHWFPVTQGPSPLAPDPTVVLHQPTVTLTHLHPLGGVQPRARGD